MLALVVRHSLRNDGKWETQDCCQSLVRVMYFPKALTSQVCETDTKY